MEIIGNRYYLLDELGEGGMGVVYRAHDRLTGDVIAIKRVNNPAILTTSQAAEFRLALAQEFRILATIRHPNIISVIDYGFDGQHHPYYAMELLTNAQTILAFGEHLDLSDKIDLMIQTLQAIAYLHRRGVIHRDLKPDNILVVNEQVKVLDFGLAAAHTPEDKESPMAGTIAYMPPEVLKGKGFSTASDLYAVGIMGFELFAGHYPFDTTDMMRLLNDILATVPDLSLLAIPDDLKMVIGRLLTKDPTDRYQDAGQVIQELIAASGVTIVYETSATRESFLQSARFIGRTAEIARLSEALRNAAVQQGSLWLIGGESGVGKSRLMEEIRTLALVESVVVLRGQAIVEGGAAYLLWRNVLRHLSLKVTLSDLEASVIKALVPDIAALIERPVADAPALEPDAEQNRLLNTLEAVFRRHTDPTLIIMEDLQWARESLGVMSKLAKIIGTLPLIMIGTFRDDERPDLPAQFPEAQTIRLKRLNNTEIADLSESILGSATGRRESLIELLRIETEGNAFFIVEIVRALAEAAGQLAHIGEATLPSTVFAGGIRAAIQQRLARVPREAYTMLEWLAVAGREIDLKLIPYLQPALQIDGWLLDCGSVLEVQDNIWRFAHDKLREAVLETIAPDVLAIRHGEVATAIAAAYPDDPAYYVRLAYHWREAGQPEQEHHFNVLAGKAALALGNYQEAIDFLQRALAYLQAHHRDPQRQASLIKQIGTAYFGLGQLNDAYANFNRTLAPTAHTHPATRWALYRQLALGGLQQVRYALIPPRKPEVAQGEYLRDAASAAEQLAIIHYFRNEKFYAIYYALKGVNLAEQARQAHRDQLSRVQSSFALMLSLVPLYTLARLYYRRARSNMPDNNDVGLQSWVLMMAGLYATNTAEWDIAVPNLVQCLALAEQAGNVRRTQEALLSLAAAYFFMGEWAKSYDLAEKILASGLAYDNLQCQAWGLDDLGRVHYHYGDHAKALELFARSRQIYEQISDPSGMIWVNGALAQVYTREGDLAAARPHAEKVKSLLIDTQPGNYGLLEGYQGMADFYLTQYEQERTPQNQQDADTAVMLVHRFGAIFNTGKAYRYVYAAWLAGIRGETSKALRLNKYAMQAAERYGLPYEAGLAAYHTARFLPPQHPQRAALMQQAQQTFERIGAKWDAARATE